MQTSDGAGKYLRNVEMGCEYDQGRGPGGVSCGIELKLKLV